KLVGIINGVDVSRWDPEKDKKLINWTDPVTNTPINLSFGPNSPNAYELKQQCKLQLQKCIETYWLSGRLKEQPKPPTEGLEGHPPTEGKPFTFDFTKPIVTYVGRFEPYQKGLDKFDEAIRSTLDNGGQFIIMGSQETPEAKAILDELE